MQSPQSKKSPRQACIIVAQRQGGLLTARQASALGWKKQHLRYHACAGNLRRVTHGLYRFPELTPSPFDDLLRATLAATDRRGVPIATISHVSALLVHAIGESMPSKIHLTVAPSVRRRFGKGVVVHRAILKRADMTMSDGVRVTTILRTLHDLANDAEFPPDQFRSAIADATMRGMVNANGFKHFSSSH